MDSIPEIVNQAITTGNLSNNAIQKLRDLLKLRYYEEDIDALMLLHHAVVTGRVQHKNEQNQRNMKKNYRGIVKMKLVCQTTFAAVIVGTIVFAMPKSEQSVFSNEVTTVDIWQK
ncbi:MAG: hypothetical protein IGS39_08605 [Calothrix sp. C42_A2020_038]|nr:hypothetical protein [Calothrix sp. C42_A2020_038]